MQFTSNLDLYVTNWVLRYGKVRTYAFSVY